MRKEVSINELEKRLRPKFDRAFPLGRGGDKMRLLTWTLEEVVRWLKMPVIKCSKCGAVGERVHYATCPTMKEAENDQGKDDTQEM